MLSHFYCLLFIVFIFFLLFIFFYFVFLLFFFFFVFFFFLFFFFFFFFFFFSSRRRHTRFSRDWSSDVCSSDLQDPFMQAHAAHAERMLERGVRPREVAVERDRDIQLESGHLRILSVAA